jgi:hypothetical protein
MTGMKFAPMAMILTLVLGALPAAAEHRTPQRGDAELERLSIELAKATEELRDEFTESHRSWRFHRPDTLKTLDRLERDAKRFHRRVERNGVNDPATHRAFRQLESSFNAANERFPALKSRLGIRRDFARVARLMERVETRMARIDQQRDHRRRASHDHDGDHADGWRIAWSFGH